MFIRSGSSFVWGDLKKNLRLILDSPDSRVSALPALHPHAMAKRDYPLQLAGEEDGGRDLEGILDRVSPFFRRCEIGSCVA